MDRASFLAGLAAFFAPVTGRFLPPQAITVSMLVENNRIYVDANYSGEFGREATLQTQIDTGGGALMLARRVVNDLGLQLRGKPDGQGFVQIAAPGVSIASDPISIGFAATTTTPSSVVGPGGSAPAFLPGAYLRNYAVTFDYTNDALGLNTPPLAAAPIPVQIAAKSAFPRIELVIDGQAMGFLLDTGASFTMLSENVIERLRAKNPSWPTVRGAYGPANMLGGPMERNATMLRIPQVRFGPMLLESIDVVSRPAGTFEHYMSSLMSAPVVGALGGNVLRNFALRLDYPQQRLEARFTRRIWRNELSMVPLTLEPRSGAFFIAGTLEHGDLVGARLIAVDGHELESLSLYAVQQLLRGVPGTTKTVSIVDSESRSRDVTVTVRSIL